VSVRGDCDAAHRTETGPSKPCGVWRCHG
jgi:hypothetical protein